MRQRFTRGFALVVALLAFLRAPFDDAPGPRQTGAGGLETSTNAETWVAAWSEIPFVTTPAARAHADDRTEVPMLWRTPEPADARLHAVSTSPLGLGTQIEERLTLLESYGDLEAGRDVLMLLGAEHQALGDFGGAAEFFESAVTGDAAVCGEDVARCDAIAASLENAFIFRRALGAHDVALEDASLFEQRFARTHPRASTRIALAASELLGPEARTEALRRLRRRRLPPAEAIQAEVRFAQSARGQERMQAYRRAERLWERHGGRLMATSPGLSPTEWAAELGRTREAVAEARFERANTLFRRARHNRPPAYTGPATERNATRWVERRLRPWMQRRMAQMRRAEAALNRVDGLGLSRQSVAAAALRGELQHDLAQDLMQLDVPGAVESVDETIGAIPQERESLRRHLVEPALAHWRACMQAARDTLGYGEWSDRCADALADYEPEYAPMHELRPAPAY